MADHPRPAQRHLVIVDHTARLSGAELALREMAGWSLAERVTVVLHEDGPLVADLRHRGVDVLVRPLPGALRLSRSTGPSPTQLARATAAAVAHSVQMLLLIRRLRADVVYLNTLSALILTSLPARLSGRRVVWHVRDAIAPPHTGERTARIIRLWARLTCSAVIANSGYTLAQLGEMPRRVRRLVLPSPVPQPVERAVPAGTSAGLTVAMVGRLTEWKGQHVFLDAFSAAFAGRPGYRALVAGAPLFPGDDRYAAELAAQTRRLGIDDQVSLLGHVTDVPELLARADVVVHASIKPEPFGQVVVQGLLSGAAVVATDAGGPAETVVPGVTGLLVAPNDVTALTAALVRLDGDRALVRQLAEEGAAVGATYGAEAIEQRLREFLGQL